MLDLVTAAAVEEGSRNDPPANPVVGACYLVGNAPTGAWAGQSQSLAGYTSGGWRYIAATEGLAVYVKSTGTIATCRSGGWEIGSVRAASLIIGGEQVVGSRAAAVSDPSGGSTVDAEARATITLVLQALRQHGLIES